MYATCLFCNGALGANEAIEHFPVGRRLAYDAATGRLWVVCKSCARWNLSPLESRWEAIEEAERAFRSTKLRVSSDNIGLAQLAEGTELVRIGKPPQLEFAAWRYGDEFGKRHRNAWKAAGAGMAVGVGGSALVAASVMVPRMASVVGIGGISAFLVLNFGHTVFDVVNTWVQRHKLRATVRDNDGRILRLSRGNAGAVAMMPIGPALDWRLRVPRNIVKSTGPLGRMLGVPERGHFANDVAFISGDAARRALATLLPQVNSYGATKKGVNEAIDVINEAPSIEYLLHKAAISTSEYQKQFHIDEGESKLASLAPSLRLALEMSMHEEDERRAMEGELQQLEERWRDADALAKISDNLLLPADIDERLHAMHEAPATTRTEALTDITTRTVASGDDTVN